MTVDEDEMLEITNIDPKKVQLYGKNFLKLIRASQQRYESIMRDQEDRPQDPNHQNVIDISSDNESIHQQALDESVDEYGSQEQRSSYFKPPADVQAFNARCMFSLPRD